MTVVAVIGFGEAGPVFARAFAESGAEVRAFDVAAAGAPEAFRARTSPGVRLCEDRADAVRGADVVLSTVTASNAEAAASELSSLLSEGQTYVDLNSCGPDAKRAIAARVRPAVFVEAVAMDTVPVRGAEVPILLSGPDAASAEPRLRAFGLEAEAIGPEVGMASTVKLCRSVVIKGMEAVFAEALLAAGAAGVEDRVIGSLDATFPGIDWTKTSAYLVSRLAIHGARRAGEMVEASRLLRTLGIDPLVTDAVAERHRWAASSGLSERYLSKREDGPTLTDFLTAIAKKESLQNDQ